MKNILLCLILMSCCSNKSGNGQADSFFPLTYFDKATVAQILKNDKCAGIRVYPVIDGNGDISTMIIGIDASGGEMHQNVAHSGTYRMFSGVTGVKPSNVGLNKSQALIKCKNYTSARTGFVSDINRSLIEGLLATAKAEGIMLTYVAQESGNFEAQAYKAMNGHLEGLGNGKPGLPCPTACGTSSNYLCFP